MTITEKPMTKQRLKRYYAKRVEIDVLDATISINHPEQMVSDIVQDGLHHLTIRGYGSNKIPLWAERKTALESECHEIERFIDGIDDSLTRLAISLKYINGLSWQQVAASIGGGNTADGIRMLCTRYLSNN